MNYLQRLWRAELFGLASLAVVSLPIAIVLTLFFDLGPVAQSDIPLVLIVFAVAYSFGFMPVVTYGAPIFAFYLFNPSFRLMYLLGFAALPGVTLFLASGSEKGLGIVAYGLLVAITMCGMARWWHWRNTGKAA